MQELLFDPRLINSTLTQITAALSCSEEHSDPPHQIPPEQRLSRQEPVCGDTELEGQETSGLERKRLDFAYQH